MSTTALLVFARCLGFVFRAPGFSHPSVPRALRAGIALALSIAILPSVHTVNANGFELFVFVVLEFVLGAAIGMSAALIYDAAYAGGRMLDDYVGVKAIAPSVALVAPSGFGRLWSLTFTTAFFLLGAYRPVVLGFAGSFDHIIPGSFISMHDWLHFATTFATTIVLAGMSVAAPAIALAFVVQVAIASLGRTIPRLGTFTLSFPLVFASVLIVTAVSLPLVVNLAAHPILRIPGVP